MKQCSKCNQLKELTEYYERHTTKDRLCSWCKTCHKEKVKQSKWKRPQNSHIYTKHVPAWLTPEDWRVMAGMYESAKHLSRILETKMVVDHIIPLRGNFVSGLHVPANLQIISESENATKRNHFIVDN